MILDRRTSHTGIIGQHSERPRVFLDFNLRIVKFPTPNEFHNGHCKGTRDVHSNSKVVAFLRSRAGRDISHPETSTTPKINPIRNLGARDLLRSTKRCPEFFSGHACPHRVSRYLNNRSEKVWKSWGETNPSRSTRNVETANLEFTKPIPDDPSNAMNYKCQANLSQTPHTPQTKEACLSNRAMTAPPNCSRNKKKGMT